MSEYSLYDFSETVNNYDSPIKADAVKYVIAAWGYSPEGWGSWEGGFLLQLKDERFAYLTGWCDTSGWGCQDGMEAKFYDTQPALNTLGPHADREKEDWDHDLQMDEWDPEPADLNKWIANGAKDEDRWA